MIRIALFLAALPASALAQETVCAPRDVMVIGLAEGYGEVRRSVMLTPGGFMFEMFANPETGTWSYLRTSPDHTMCMMVSGSDYEEVTDRPPPNL